LRRVAESYGVAVCRVRKYPELLAEQDWLSSAPWAISAGRERIKSIPAPHTRADAPLAGLRVVEVTSRLQGPLAGLLLSMLGASVLKVEPPGGDMGKYAPPRVGSQGAAYLAYNRGKQVIEIDYKRPEGLAHLADLAAGADVFLHNWRSGRAEKLGLDFADLAQSNPGLVYAHASGWGRSGAEPSPIAGDFLVQAHAGCGDGLNPAGRPALPSRLTLVDVTGGLLASEGILAGLYWRERTGQGCRVDTSLLAGAMALQRHVLRTMSGGQEAGRRQGRPLWGQLDQPLETADGLLMIVAEDAPTRARLARIVGLTPSEGLAQEQRIAERLHTRSASEWVALLSEASVPAAVVRTDLADAPRDPLLVDLLESIDDACWVPAAPWQLKA
jgi:crotonobetainyl-CoA:carnitine CoA-transferase CaiB-like acyl-CoA transferase